MDHNMDHNMFPPWPRLLKSLHETKNPLPYPYPDPTKKNEIHMELIFCVWAFHFPDKIPKKGGAAFGGAPFVAFFVGMVIVLVMVVMVIPD